MYALYAIALFFASGVAFAAPSGVPSSMTLHDESNARNSIQVDCSANHSGSTLECTFFQMSVSYELEPGELEQANSEEVGKIRGKHPDYENLLTEVKKLCLSADDRVKLKDTIQKDNDQLVRLVQLMDRACLAKSNKEAEAAAINFIKYSNEMDSATCKVWPNTWKENFSLEIPVGDTDDYWLASPAPTGPCGVINASTLTRDGEYFWRYDSRRVITNPKGSVGLMSCKDMPERTSAYSWREKSHPVNCKLIKFGF